MFPSGSISYGVPTVAATSVRFPPTSRPLAFPAARHRGFGPSAGSGIVYPPPPFGYRSARTVRQNTSPEYPNPPSSRYRPYCGIGAWNVTSRHFRAIARCRAVRSENPAMIFGLSRTAG